MAESWTREQSEANAELNAQEFANRQILLRGVGSPTVQAPIGSEYEDTSTEPRTRYRKIGEGVTDWQAVPIVHAATEQEVTNGVDQAKMVTPATLATRLNGFATEVLGLEPPNTNTESTHLDLLASTDNDNAVFTVTIPVDYAESVLSVRLLGYGSNATLDNVIGGPVGLLLNIRRGEQNPVTVDTNETVKLSSSYQWADNERLDNITLQRISDTTWVEVTRKNFS